MTDDVRKPSIRARQRSRTALRPFSSPLQPQEPEIGVDRMQVAVRGTWSLEREVPLLVALTPDHYRQMVARRDERRPWFRKPEELRARTIIRTRARAPTSLGSTHVVIRGWPNWNGTYEVSLKCNPTATLAHLLRFPPEDLEFTTWLLSLDPFAFFDRRGVLPSLDNAENWLPDIDLATRLLGPDIFGRFFPIFVRQLMRLVAQLVAPFGERLHIRDEGTDQVLEAPYFSGRLEWGSASVPQIETYFERHHSHAPLAVRSAALAMITGLDEARMRRHSNRVSFERQESLFSLRTEIPAERYLSVYAKAPERLRFEITRPRRGRYSPQLLFTPEDRLLQIFRSERADLLISCDWELAGSFFEEPSVPTMSDLIGLITAITDACSASETSAQRVLEALLIDGGLNPTLNHVSEEVTQRLLARGVIERKTLRRRDRSGEHRLVLSEQHRHVMERVLGALSNPN
jgi:hypothetical protein